MATATATDFIKEDEFVFLDGQPALILRIGDGTLHVATDAAGSEHIPADHPGLAPIPEDLDMGGPEVGRMLDIRSFYGFAE